jgi:hypothetical protein
MKTKPSALELRPASPLLWMLLMGSSGGLAACSSQGSSQVAGVAEAGVLDATREEASVGEAGGVSADGAEGTQDATGARGGDGGMDAPSCATSLLGRLTSKELQVDGSIVYTASTVYDAYTFDQRLQLAVQPNGEAQVAWVEAATGQVPKDVRVTPLTSSLDRRGDDQVISGSELSGFVAHDDGFAALVRDLDPGPSVSLDDAVDNSVDYAAVLTRYTNGAQAFRVPLTGRLAPTPSDNYCLFLYGTLRWDGTRYGAYFDTRGGMGSPAQGHNGDRLTILDGSGHQLSGGWSWGCSHSYRRALLPVAGEDFLALCVSDAYPQLGLQVVNSIYTNAKPANPSLDPRDLTQLYDAVAPLPDGSFVVVWGATRADNQPTDLAFARVSASRALTTSSPQYLTSTPTTAEAYPHVALYGTGALLVTWDEIAGSTTCSHVGCDGHYVATHMRLMDFSGNFLTDDETFDGPMNTFAEITRFPNGDLGWAYAKTSTPARGVGTYGVTFAPSSTIVLDRLAVCQP